MLQRNHWKHWNCYGAQEVNGERYWKYWPFTAGQHRSPSMGRTGVALSPHLEISVYWKAQSVRQRLQFSLIKRKENTHGSNGPSHFNFALRKFSSVPQKWEHSKATVSVCDHWSLLPSHVVISLTELWCFGIDSAQCSLWWCLAWWCKPVIPVSTQGAEAGGSPWIWGHPGLSRGLKTSKWRWRNGLFSILLPTLLYCVAFPSYTCHHDFSKKKPGILIGKRARTLEVARKAQNYLWNLFTFLLGRQMFMTYQLPKSQGIQVSSL